MRRFEGWRAGPEPDAMVRGSCTWGALGPEKVYPSPSGPSCPWLRPELRADSG